MDNSPIPQPPPPPPATQLIQTLEQATQMAKQLRTATDPTHLFQIYASLHQTYHFLSSFLHQPLPLFPSTAGEEEEENGEGEPMQVVGEEEEEEEEGGVDKVEERFRNCFIKNKRVKKRHLSPSSMAAGEERRLGDDGGCVVGVVEGFDPLRTRVRSLELVHQFHA